MFVKVRACTNIRGLIIKRNCIESRKSETDKNIEGTHEFVEIFVEKTVSGMDQRYVRRRSNRESYRDLSIGERSYFMLGSCTSSTRRGNTDFGRSIYKANTVTGQ